MPYFIAVAGNMGVGKSTLTDKLADKLSWERYLEPVAANPYLSDFYKNMKRWSFHSQMFFLTHRLQQHIKLIQSKNHVVQDRSVYENAEVFARNLYERGLMSERDWETYSNTYHLIVDLLPPPNLIVYLKASVSTLQRRISTRGRDYEQDVDPKYLEELNILYDKWASTCNIAPVLTVNTNRINFVENERALDDLSEKILTRVPIQTLPLYKNQILI